MPIERDFFFQTARGNPFGGAMSASQVSGTSVILDSWETEQSGSDERWLAYMLGTAFHETARTMEPVKEAGGVAYLTKLYDVGGDRPALAQQMGNTELGDGVRYAGRGFVQLTWKNNYRLMSGVVGDDLVADPELALEPNLACKIMFYGMGHGSFTGRALGDYFAPDVADWIHAREIINGLDQAALIAGYGKAFLAAITVVS